MGFSLDKLRRLPVVVLRQEGTIRSRARPEVEKEVETPSYYTAARKVTPDGSGRQPPGFFYARFKEGRYAAG
jgi:hypothetical protein